MSSGDTENPELPKPKEYGELLYDKSKLFHGIGFDLIRLKRILEHGIFSENAAREKGLSVARNYGGYNLNDTVSVTESPSVHGTFTFGAFFVYIKNGIGLVIDNTPLDGVKAFRAPQMRGDYETSTSRASGFVDEACIVHEVPRRNIVGVMVPEDALDRPLSELRLGLDKIGTGYINNRCRSLVTEIEKELGYSANLIPLEALMRQKDLLDKADLSYLEKRDAQDRVFNEMDRFIAEYTEQAYKAKLGKDRVVLRDILREYVPSGVETYNSDGFPISL